MEADWPDSTSVAGFVIWASASSYSSVQFIPDKTPLTLSPGDGTGCEPSFVYQLGASESYAENTLVLNIGWLESEEPTTDRWLRIHRVE